MTTRHDLAARLAATDRLVWSLGDVEIEPPDPYAHGIAAMRGVHIDPTPDLDPRYEKSGRTTPPDGYAIAINIAKAKKELENSK